MPANPTQFAAAVLKGIGAPVTSQNIAGFIGWSKAEGPLGGDSWARNNPLNTTLHASGTTATINSAGVKAYATPQAGVAATVQTLRNGNYGGILNAFHQNNPHALGAAIGASPWGTSGSLAAQTIAQTLGQHVAVPSSGIPQAPSAASVSLEVPKQVNKFDAQGFQQAQRRYELGQFLSNQKNPFDIGPKIPGMGANPLFSSGLLPTTAPNQADYTSAQTVLQKVAGSTPLNTHPALTSGQGDFATPAPKAVVDMQNFAKTLIGAPYSQANHAASFKQGADLIKKYGTDCSGLVSILLGHAGVLPGPVTTDTIANAPGIQPGRGQHVTIWNRGFQGGNSHMIVQIGKDWFESGGRIGKGVVHMSDQQAQQELSGGGFTPLHPKNF